MNIESLKAKQSELETRGTELINERLRLEGEHRALGKLIEELEAPTDIPVTVTPVSDNQEAPADGTPTAD